MILPSPRDYSLLHSSSHTRSAANEFPGIRQIVREVENALALRESGAIVAALNTAMPALIAHYGAQLPAWAVQARRSAYRRIELHHCPVQGFQILALVWGPGQGTPVHDHRELWGIESVWQGELDVIDFAIKETAGELLRLEPSQVSRIPAGQSLGFTPEHGLHLCRNSAPRDVTISVHIYARALDAFNQYVDVGNGWYERREHVPALEF